MVCLAVGTGSVTVCGAVVTTVIAQCGLCVGDTLHTPRTIPGFITKLQRIR